MLRSAFILRIAVLAALVGGAGEVMAQRFLTHTYKEWDGLPTNRVLNVAQDSTGIMWFATRVGLTSYDGTDWKLEAIHPNAAPQVEAFVRVDAAGRLWTVSAHDPLRVSVRENGVWTTARFESFEFEDYHIAGLEIVTDNERDRAFIATLGGHLFIWDGQGWEHFDFQDRTGTVRSILRQGHHLFLACEKGLFHFDTAGGQGQLLACRGLPSRPIRYMAQDDTGQQLWLAGQDWIRLWAEDVTIARFDGLDIVAPGEGDRTTALADRCGGFFFGGPGGIQYFHPASGLERLTRKNGLASDGANFFHRDREGNTWIASTRGLTKLISRRFAGYNRESGLLEDEVSAITEMPDGTLVLGHEGGISLITEGIGRLNWAGNPFPTARVMDFDIDPRGRLWAATDRRGVVRIGLGGDLVWYGSEAGLVGQAYSLQFTPDGRLWVATSKGLFFLGEGGFQQVTVPQIPESSAQFLRRLVRDPEGGFYACSALFGLFHYQAGNFEHYLPLEGSAGSNIFNVLPEPQGQTWVGTSEGLFRLVDGALVRSEAPYPRVDRPVYSLLRDSEGQLWCGTDLGVILPEREPHRILTLKDGLLGNECNRDALHQDRQGRIWIGTDGGASAFRHRYDTRPTAAPLVRITGFRINGRVWPADQDIRLDEPPLSLEVVAKGLSFLDEQEIRYRTRLENFEDDWHAQPTGSPGFMNYIYVPSGSYRFQVQAIRSDGVTSNVAFSPWIIIQPRFWDRWYTRVAMGLGIIVLIWALIALASGRRYAQRLEKEVYQHTWELRLSEQNIKAESRRLAATLQNIHDGVLAVGAKGVVVLANPAAGEILGQTPAELVGRQADQLLPLPSRTPRSEPSRVSPSSRPDQILEVAVTPVEAEQPGGSGQVVVFRDITDQVDKEAERIRSQKLESLGVFAGGLAHDFNNLLTVMLGNISTLEENPRFQGEDAQMLSLVREASQRAQNLTNQLLTFARGGEPLLEEASIAEIVRKSVEFSLSGTRVRCRMDLEPNLRPVEVDPGQIDQVIANLAINAVQAMPGGGILRVKACNIGSEEQPMVMVEVRDEGMGISEENLTRVFDPYFSTKKMGSGLGLAIAYSIVSRHGGHISVESEPGQGATFRVFLRAGAGA